MIIIDEVRQLIQFVVDVAVIAIAQSQLKGGVDCEKGNGWESEGCKVILSYRNRLGLTCTKSREVSAAVGMPDKVYFFGG
jgi:hypothetical protein